MYRPTGTKLNNGRTIINSARRTSVYKRSLLFYNVAGPIIGVDFGGRFPFFNFQCFNIYSALELIHVGLQLILFSVTEVVFILELSAS